MTSFIWKMSNSIQKLGFEKCPLRRGSGTFMCLQPTSKRLVEAYRLKPLWLCICLICDQAKVKVLCNLSDKRAKTDRAFLSLYEVNDVYRHRIASCSQLYNPPLSIHPKLLLEAIQVKISHRMKTDWQWMPERGIGRRLTAAAAALTASWSSQWLRKRERTWSPSGNRLQSWIFFVTPGNSIKQPTLWVMVHMFWLFTNISMCAWEYCREWNHSALATCQASAPPSISASSSMRNRDNLKSTKPLPNPISSPSFWWLTLSRHSRAAPWGTAECHSCLC